MLKIILQIFLFYSLSGCQLFSVYNKNSKTSPLTKKTEIKVKTGLFISGAGANTFATLSLLELLQNQKIQFDFYGGTGWGAWLAAVYSKNQSIDEVKWNLFKLQNQGIFKKNWFNQKIKQFKLFDFLNQEIFQSNVNIPFVCPVLNKNGKLIWMTEKQLALSVLNCINNNPSLLISFYKATKGSGSLFSADAVIQYMKNKKISRLIWIQPSVSSKKPLSNNLSLIFWKELKSYLNRIQKTAIKKYPNLIILKSQHPSYFSLDDFTKLNVIIKTPAPLKEKEIIYKL